MRAINVYAYHSDFGALCRKAMLDNESGLAYPKGDRQGQAGWHVAVKFKTLNDLASNVVGLKMPKEYCGRWFRDCDAIQRGEVTRLGIMVHGEQGGKLYVHGKGKKPVLTADTVPQFHADLHRIGLATSQNASIIFMGCLAGQGDGGTKLLVALSKCFPGRKVIGFATLGYRHPGAMKRPGQACELPGMRETDAPAEIYQNPPKYDRQWGDFDALPWASEHTRHAKVAMNGGIIRYPEEEQKIIGAAAKAKGKAIPPLSMPRRGVSGGVQRR